MPRNPSGTYTLPYPTFYPNTVISSANVNSNFDDIATAITGSLAVNGSTPITGPFKFAAGTVGAPGITFSSDTTTGVFLQAAGQLAFSTSGVIAGYFDTSQKFWASGDASIAGNVAITGALASGSATITGTLQVSGAITFTTPLSTANIANGAITNPLLASASVNYANIQNVTNLKLLGNFSGGAAAPSEYGLGTNLAVTGSTLDTKWGPHAWVTWTMSGTSVTVRQSFNVTSVVRNSIGNFTITFTNPMTDIYYVATATGQRSGSNNLGYCIDKTTAPTTNAFVLDVVDPGTGGGNDPLICSVAIFGN